MGARVKEIKENVSEMSLKMNLTRHFLHWVRKFPLRNNPRAPPTSFAASFPVPTSQVPKGAKRRETPAGEAEAAHDRERVVHGGRRQLSSMIWSGLVWQEGSKEMRVWYGMV